MTLTVNANQMNSFDCAVFGGRKSSPKCPFITSILCDVEDVRFRAGKEVSFFDVELEMAFSCVHLSPVSSVPTQDKSNKPGMCCLANNVGK